MGTEKNPDSYWMEPGWILKKTRKSENFILPKTKSKSENFILSRKTLFYGYIGEKSTTITNLSKAMFKAKGIIN